mgnify:CR=1 FL=1
MVAEIEAINDNNLLLIDDKTFPNKILYFTFNKYILKGTLNYFSHIQKNVFFIKDEKLPENILNELKNYEHLVSYAEVNKSDIV